MLALAGVLDIPGAGRWLTHERVRRALALVCAYLLAFGCLALTANGFVDAAAALCPSAVLASPYGYDYDMMVVAPAIAFLTSDRLAHGCRPWDKTALAALWLAPL